MKPIYFIANQKKAEKSTYVYLVLCLIVSKDLRFFPLRLAPNRIPLLGMSAFSLHVYRQSRISFTSEDDWQKGDAYSPTDIYLG